MPEERKGCCKVYDELVKKGFIVPNNQKNTMELLAFHGIRKVITLVHCLNCGKEL